VGDLPVEKGGTIRSARIVWQTHGTLNAERSNAILYPCGFLDQHKDMAWLVGPDGILDPTRWFVIIPNMFSNGLSSSAASTQDYPAIVTAADNVRAQSRLLSERFGIERLAAVYGFSMGAQQAYHWAALFPDAVARAIIVCGSARTSTHNKVFLSSLLRTLEAAPEHLGHGRFSGPPHLALRAFAHIYASWALSQDFYRANLHLSAFPTPDLDGFLKTYWEERYRSRDATNMHAQLTTWFHSDISDNRHYGGDLPRALGAISARVLLMPGQTDLYFRVADNAAELPCLKQAELRPIPSLWGHRAGNPVTIPEDRAFVKSAVRDWLSR
jgi:homoserine O-acetyltransferase